MDSSFLTASDDKHKNEPSKSQKSSEGQDMISNLPNFIIAHILSFVPIKDAVRTSALSQGWRYMWTFVTELSFKDHNKIITELSFEDRNKINKTGFVNFVKTVLRDLKSASIKTFSLSLAEKYDPDVIDEWISSVLNRRVKKISVHSPAECNISCDPIFKCQSLEELVLEMDRSIIQFPSFVHLSSLTVLHLSTTTRTTFVKGMTVTCYSSNESKELTLNFPVLRDFKARYCTWLGVKCVTLEAPLLEVVVIINNHRFRLSQPDVPHAEIKICASHITEFCYTGNASLETILLDASIAEAKISLLSLKVETLQQMGIFVRKLFSINNVERLQLSLPMHQSHATMEDCLADIPTFGMLRHLQLFFVSGEILIGLLLKSPCLETLDITAIQSYYEGQMNFSVVPGCFVSTLKEVKIDNFLGREQELSFAKFVMEKGQVLERISFLCSQVEKVKKEIFSVKTNHFLHISIGECNQQKTYYIILSYE